MAFGGLVITAPSAASTRCTTLVPTSSVLPIFKMPIPFARRPWMRFSIDTSTGRWSHPLPNQTQDHSQDHRAGEATCDAPIAGTVHGAIASGRRAARSVLIARSENRA